MSSKNIKRQQDSPKDGTPKKRRSQQGISQSAKSPSIHVPGQVASQVSVNKLKPKVYHATPVEPQPMRSSNRSQRSPQDPTRFALDKELKEPKDRQRMDDYIAFLHPHFRFPVENYPIPGAHNILPHPITQASVQPIVPQTEVSRSTIALTSSPSTFPTKATFASSMLPRTQNDSMSDTQSGGPRMMEMMAILQQLQAERQAEKAGRQAEIRAAVTAELQAEIHAAVTVATAALQESLTTLETKHFDLTREVRTLKSRQPLPTDPQAFISTLREVIKYWKNTYPSDVRGNDELQQIDYEAIHSSLQTLNALTHTGSFAMLVYGLQAIPDLSAFSQNKKAADVQAPATGGKTDKVLEIVFNDIYPFPLSECHYILNHDLYEGVLGPALTCFLNFTIISIRKRSDFPCLSSELKAFQRTFIDDGPNGRKGLTEIFKQFLKEAKADTTRQPNLVSRDADLLRSATDCWESYVRLVEDRRRKLKEFGYSCPCSNDTCLYFHEARIVTDAPHSHLTTWDIPSELQYLWKDATGV